MTALFPVTSSFLSTRISFSLQWISRSWIHKIYIYSKYYSKYVYLSQKLHLMWRMPWNVKFIIHLPGYIWCTTYVHEQMSPCVKEGTVKNLLNFFFACGVDDLWYLSSVWFWCNVDKKNFKTKKVVVCSTVYIILVFQSINQQIWPVAGEQPTARESVISFCIFTI